MAHPTVHRTLTPDQMMTVDIVIDEGEPAEHVIVAFREDGPAGTVWYTLDDTDAVIEQDGAYWVSNNAIAFEHVREGSAAIGFRTVRAKLISSVAAKFSVMVA